MLFIISSSLLFITNSLSLLLGKGGKNYKKGKKDNDGEARRDLIYKEDGQGIAL